ncbi:Ig-like domain-containing protein [Neobacillus sp. SuZ13]|uniref:Ig-like domain-containing protein n=1 Tax=Neobacillus sp. SuZ13 TaxID=3047875 RepID=UPI0024BFA9D9|nr:Ig-like domain-containing protein [Neobacillus sp. SuZ13]WHY66807.1 Ig-like domain-containing protein [Neobacillus sp. SuZ13]
MRKLLQRVALSAALPLLVLLAWGHTPVFAEGTVITNYITEDTVFKKEGSPYYINAWVQIGKYATLTIEPGVELISKPGTGNGFTVYGKLRALGTAAEPIKMQGMYISAWTTWTKEAAIQLDHTVVSNANMDIQDLQVTVTNSEFSKANLSLSGTFATIENSFFHDQAKIGFTSTGLKPGNLSVKGNTFINDGSGYTDVKLSRRDTSTAPMTITENNFFGTNRLAVKLDGPSPGWAADGTNNYWGTTDSTLVNRSVYDGSDLGYGDRLNYQPYAYKPFANGFPMGAMLAPQVKPISDSSAMVKGTTDAEATVNVLKNGTFIAEGSTKADGTFEIPIPVQTGGTNLTISVTDSYKRTSETSIIVQDETAPEMPQINPVTDQSEVVSGTSEANALVTLKINDTELTRTSDNNGNFSIPISKQTVGTLIELTATDAAKNVSQPAKAIVLDGTLPAKLEINEELTDQTIMISGKVEPGTTVEMQAEGKIISTATAGTDGVFTLNWSTPIKAGTQVVVTAIDPANNRSDELTITVKDKTAPVLTLDFVFPPTTTNPTVKGTSEPGATIQVVKNSEIIATGVAVDNGTFNITIPAQTKGTILEVQAIDNAGNTSSKTVEVLEIDTTPPPAPTVDDINIFSTAVTGITEPNVTVNVIILDQTYTGESDDNGHFSITIPKQPVNNSVFIQAIDQHGNMSEMVVKVVKSPIGWYVDANGSKYYFHSTTGKMTVGWLSLNGKRYYFETDGKLRTNSFRTISSKVYYFNKNGEMQTYWLTLNLKKYYFGSDGVRRTGIVQIGTKKYYFASDGTMKTGWIALSSKKYYFNSDGTMKTGWATLSGKKYYFNSDGTMKTGWATLSGKKYYFNSDGTMKTGWLKLGTKKYYFNSDGTMKTGWLKLGTKKYYFNSDGTMKTGWLKLGTKKYYFNSDGTMKTGWLKLGTKKYYFNISGVMQTGWETIGGKRYYFNSSGVKVK